MKSSASEPGLRKYIRYLPWIIFHKVYMSGNLLGRDCRRVLYLLACLAGVRKRRGKEFGHRRSQTVFSQATTSRKRLLILRILFWVDGGLREIRMYAPFFPTPCQCKKLAAGHWSDYSLVKYYFEIFVKTNQDNCYIHWRLTRPRWLLESRFWTYR